MRASKTPEQWCSNQSRARCISAAPRPGSATTGGDRQPSCPRRPSGHSSLCVTNNYESSSKPWQVHRFHCLHHSCLVLWSGSLSYDFPDRKSFLHTVRRFFRTLRTVGSTALLETVWFNVDSSHPHRKRSDSALRGQWLRTSTATSTGVWRRFLEQTGDIRNHPRIMRGRRRSVALVMPHHHLCRLT